MNTINSIMINLYLKEKVSSFGFMGAPTKKETGHNNRENINSDGTVRETKRYNIYNLYVKRYYSPTDFEHVEIPSSSCYVVKSKLNTQLTKEKIESFFIDYINAYC